MKKVSCIMLILALILTAFATVSAEGSITRLYTFESSATVGSMTVYDGKLIATDDTTNYVVINPSGDAEPIEYSFEDLMPELDGWLYVNHFLVPADDGIYMTYYGYPVDDTVPPDTRVILQKMTLDGNKLASETHWELNWQPVRDALGSFAAYETLWEPCIVNGRLIGNVYPKDGPGYIAIFDYANGTCQLIDNTASVMCSYKDGLVLVEDLTEESAVISGFDPETGDCTELVSIPRDKYYGTAYAAYDAENDRLFFVRNNELFALTDMDASAMISLGKVNANSSYYACAAMLNSETYVCSAGTSVNAYDVNALTDYETLNIANFFGSYEAETEVSVQFNERHPDVVVIDSHQVDIAGLLNGETDADICMMPVASSDFAAMYDMGLMLPLNSSAAITEQVNAMYPWVQEYIMKDGNIVALPVLLYTDTSFAHYPLAFEALGLTADDIPGTWMEFLQLLKRLPELLSENGEVTAFPSKYSISDVREMVLNEMVHSYMLYLTSNGQPISFDTPMFAELMAEYEKIDFAALGVGESAVYNTYGMTDVLFSRGDGVTPYSTSYHSLDVDAPLMLAFDDGAQPIISADLYVAFVLPGSGNSEMAIEYLELITENNPDTLNIMLSPDCNTPVISPMFEEDLIYFDGRIAEIEAAIETASEDELPGLEKDLETWRTKRDEYAAGLDFFAWDMSAESITWYRSLDDRICVETSHGLDDAVIALIEETCHEYLNGSIDAAKLINTLEDSMSMLILEAK